MMNPGAGEISDRLTILALKILHGSAAGKDVSHFVTERGQLLTKIRARTLNGVWFESLLALGAVNAAIWTAQDEMRGYRMSPEPASTDTVTVLAFRLQELNDQRADLVQRINKDAGEPTVAEKL